MSNSTGKGEGSEAVKSFTKEIEKLMRCGGCSQVPAPPYAVICADGHVFCQGCAKDLKACPMPSDDNQGVKKPLTTHEGRVCGKALRSRYSLVFTKLYDESKHYCGYEKCMQTIRGDTLHKHMMQCPQRDRMKCQLRTDCGEEWIPMNDYMMHLIKEHGIPYEFGSLHTVTLDMNNLMTLENIPCYVTNIFIRSGSGHCFALTVVKKSDEFCFTVCAIPTEGQTFTKCLYKLQLGSNNGKFRSTVGSIRYLAEVDESVNNGDCIRLGLTAVKHFFGRREELYFKIFILDTEGSTASLGWEVSQDLEKAMTKFSEIDLVETLQSYGDTKKADWKPDGVEEKVKLNEAQMYNDFCEIYNNCAGISLEKKDTFPF